MSKAVPWQAFQGPPPMAPFETEACLHPGVTVVGPWPACSPHLPSEKTLLLHSHYYLLFFKYMQMPSWGIKHKFCDITEFTVAFIVLALFSLSCSVVSSPVQLTLFLFHRVCVRARVHAQPCATLGDPVDCSPPSSSVHGSLQAKMLGWIAISFSRGSSWPKDQSHISYISCIAGRFFAAGRALLLIVKWFFNNKFSSFTKSYLC